jgi:hypothetical protein
MAAVSGVEGLLVTGNRIAGFAGGSQINTQTPSLSVDLSGPAWVVAVLAIPSLVDVVDGDSFISATHRSGDCGGALREATLHTAWRMANTAGVLPYSAQLSAPASAAMLLVGHRAPPP